MVQVLNQENKMLTKTHTQVGRESWHSRIAGIRVDQKFFHGVKTKRRMWHNRMDYVGKYGTAMTKRYLDERRIRAIKTFHRQAWLIKQKNEG